MEGPDSTRLIECCQGLGLIQWMIENNEEASLARTKTFSSIDFNHRKNKAQSVNTLFEAPEQTS